MNNLMQMDQAAEVNDLDIQVTHKLSAIVWWLISCDSFYFKLCMALVRIGLASLEMDSVSHARVSADRDNKKTKLADVF